MSLPLPAGNLNEWAAMLVNALQKGIAGKRVAFGKAATTYPGGSNFSNTMTIAHGLRAVPAIVLAFSTKAGSVEFVWPNADADETNLSLRTANPFVAPAGGTTTGCYWFAIA